MGNFSSAHEPYLKPSGAWAFSLKNCASFPRLKLTWTTLWALMARAFRVCHLELSFCIALTVEVREKQVIWGQQSVAEVGILAPPCTIPKNWGQLFNLFVLVLSL